MRERAATATARSQRRRPPAIPLLLTNPKHKSMYRTVSRRNALHLVVSFFIASLHAQLDPPAGRAYREDHSDNRRSTQDVSIDAPPFSMALTCGGALGSPSVETGTTVAVSVARVRSITLKTCMTIVQLGLRRLRLCGIRIYRLESPRNRGLLSWTSHVQTPDKPMV